MDKKISFVSSGPGDPELLTVKAVKRLEAADVVLFDDLSSGPILSCVRKDADLIGVGKRAGRKSPKQDYVSSLLLKYAKTGARVVRLKSGDSGVFGRLEEEITTLRSAGIDFEIIPGIPAAMAVAAAAGIPLTRRERARRVQFISGHDTTGQLPDDINWAALVDPNVTTVVYMGKRTFRQLSESLIERGLPADTSAIMAESISTPQQKIIRSTMSGLEEILNNDTGTGPVTIIFGPLLDL